jgi:hypothetical protein
MNGQVTMQQQRTMHVFLGYKATSTRFVGRVKSIDSYVPIQLIGYVYSIQYLRHLDE